MDKYTGTVQLMNNQLYTITAQIGDLTQTWSFTSRYSPAYSTAKLVRSVTGDLLEDLSKDKIDFAIWQASIFVDNMFPADKDRTQYDYVVKQFILYKVAYDLADMLIAQYAAESGAQEKLLGDLKITKEVKTPKIQELLANLKRQYDFWYMRLFGARAKPRSAVKAGSNAMFGDGSAESSATSIRSRRSF